MRYLFLVLISGLFFSASAQQLRVGTAAVNITPKLPAALQGQMYLRVGDSIESPLTANAIVMETGNDTAVFVSCDLTFITSELSRSVRKEVAKRIPGFSINKIILTATHTHTVPVYDTGASPYPIPSNILQPREYFRFLTDKISGVIAQAWKLREPASVSWGLGHAVVAQNRRAWYDNGRAGMYGGTDNPGFLNIEGMEDHDMNALFFQNKKGKLIAVCVDVPCPSQEVEGHKAVNADYWHDVRVALRKRWGAELAVIAWAGASGDQSPHFLYRAKSEERMAKLAGRTRMQEIAHRIDQTLAETYELVKKEQHNELVFLHKIDSVVLPARLVTEAEYSDAKTNAERLRKRISENPGDRNQYQAEMLWYQDVVDRYNNQKQKADTIIQTEIHAVRLGDAVIATNEFELFTDYGVRMQGRSKALQTFVVQLAVGYYIYLPTEIAVKGGGYSAIIQSCMTTPAGGTILVNRSVALMNSLFEGK